MSVYEKDELMIIDTDSGKVLSSPNYNFIFDKETGEFIRYGATKEDDPSFSIYGPEIVDLEITTICSGPRGKLCSFCYKSNNQYGSNMDYPTFVSVIDKLPKTVTQIAFGADSTCTSNPDIWKMMKYCRESDIVPNITVAEVYDDVADNLAKYCGAVAISRYDDKDICYDSVKKLTDKGMDQINIHIMISEETFEQVKETLHDIIVKRDPRLSKLNAIVFLSLKNKGRGEDFTRLSQDHFTEIVDTCLSYGVRFGFDSCSAIKFMNSIKGHENEMEMLEMIEPCESSKFSAYINVDGNYFPCSFIEGTKGWEEGLNVSYCDDFLEDVWNHPRNVEFRNGCLSCLNKGIACQVYKI
jgi:hypothetical protein